MLMAGTELVGGAVASVDVGEVKVPRCEREGGENQFPAPPRPVCAYSWDVVCEGCGGGEGAGWAASMSLGAC